MTLSLGTQEAALLARDPHVEGVQKISTEAIPSAPLHPIEAHTTTNWTLGNYAYDGSGNIRKIGSDLFVYDGKNRLPRADAGAAHQQEYAYDRFGNLHTVLTDVPATLERTTATLSPYRTRVAINPATNRAEYPGSETNQPNTVDPLTQQSYSMAAVYDSRGNATTLQIARADTFEYDVLDMARKASIANDWRLYIYSASDERIGTIDLASQNGAEVTSDWTFRDMGGQVLRRMRRSSNGAWTWKEDYIYRDGQLLAAQVPDAVKVKHFHLDHLGSPRLITGNGGIELSRHTYYAFGGEAGGSSSGEKQFTGHERDSATLDYMHARYYYPQMGRFLSIDPETNIKRALREPQMWNRYSYVVNNSLRYADPTGRYKCQGTTADCATIEEAVQKVRTAAANLPAGSEEQTRAAATAKLYGRPEQKTGVVVKIGPVQPNAVAETSTSGISIFKRTTVTVDLSVARTVFGASFATELAAVMAHEVQHGIDQRAGTNQGRTWADAKARELRAFTTQSYINQGLGANSVYKIWTIQGGRNDATIESFAERGATVQCQNGGGCPHDQSDDDRISVTRRLRWRVVRRP